MSPVWVVPVLVAVVGGVAVAALLRQAAAGARELIDEIGRFREAAPALARLRTDAGRARSTIVARRHH